MHVTSPQSQKIRELEHNILLQCQWNREMDTRMQSLDTRLTSLESTTRSTDSKIDLILGKFESWDTTAMRRGVLQETDEWIAPNLYQSHGSEALQP